MWFLQNRISVQSHIDIVRWWRKLLWKIWDSTGNLYLLSKVYTCIYCFSYLDVSSKISVSRGQTCSSFSGLQAGALDLHCCCGSKALAALHNPQHRQLMKKTKNRKQTSGILGAIENRCCACVQTPTPLPQFFWSLQILSGCCCLIPACAKMCNTPAPLLKG